ncbi:MAG: YbbR-like domain-containing protein [Acidobacteria bacterium]|nr:YbbR-like domain-containing protein [Acidobacteriota bacterium]
MKLLSIAVAFLFFAVSRQPSREVLLTNVPLEFVNIAPGLEVSSDLPTSVKVRLRGPRDMVQGLSANQLEVRADLSNKTTGERVIQLKPSDVTKPDKIEIRRIEPQTIELVLEPTRHKIVPIEAQIVGNVAFGYEYSVKVEPAEAEIEGPESKVERVKKILTESVHLNNRTENLLLQVDLETSKQGIRLTKFSPIQLKVEVVAKKNID